MKKLLVIAAILVATAGYNAQAAGKDATPAKPAQAQAAKPAQGQMSRPALTDEEKKKVFKEQKAKWDALSKADKVKILDKQQTDNLDNQRKRWASMTDDQKIAQREEALQRAAKQIGL